MVYEPDAIREFFKWDGQLRLGVSRAMPSKASFRRMLYDSTGSLEQDITGRRLALFLNCNVLDHACKLDGFYSLDLKEFCAVLKAVYTPRNPMSKLRCFICPGSRMGTGSAFNCGGPITAFRPWKSRPGGTR